MGVLVYRDVEKRFGALRALGGVSFEVREGEIFGLLGPNGAGKTTLIRLALDVFRPDAGEVLLFGDAPNPSSLDRTSYLPEERGLYRRARVLDVLVYLAELKGLGRKEARARALAWLERVGLGEAASRRVESLSKGNQQKVQLAAALVHEPALAILDEPFSGLDPLNAEVVRDVLLARRASGLTTLLSTHQMPVVEALCDRVALLSRGELRLYGTVDEVRARVGTDSMEEVFVRTVRGPS